MRKKEALQRGIPFKVVLIRLVFLRANVIIQHMSPFGIHSRSKN